MRPLVLASAIGLLLATPGVFARTGAPAPTIAAPVPGCDPMEIGPVYDASIDVDATLTCFQLVTPDNPSLTKLDLNFAGFRQGEVHDVSLVRVDADGSTHAVASDASGDTYRIVQGMTGPLTRWLVMVGRPAKGPASSFQMQATVAEGSDRYEPNDAIAKATPIQGNKVFEGNLDSAADVDNYLISFRADQKVAVIQIEAPVGVVIDVLDGSNTPHTLRGGDRKRVDSSRPVFVAVRGDDAPDAARYKVSVIDPMAIAVLSSYSSKENISHLAPGTVPGVAGAANVARQMEVEVTAFEGDHTTRLGAGHEVTIFARDTGKNKENWLVGSVKVVTDANGTARATLPISECKGGEFGPIQVIPRVEHPDAWFITYNPFAVVHAWVDSSDPNAQVEPLNKPQFFQHICKETVTKRWRPQ